MRGARTVRLWCGHTRRLSIGSRQRRHPSLDTPKEGGYSARTAFRLKQPVGLGSPQRPTGADHRNDAGRRPQQQPFAPSNGPSFWAVYRGARLPWPCAPAIATLTPPEACGLPRLNWRCESVGTPPGASFFVGSHMEIVAASTPRGSAPLTLDAFEFPLPPELIAQVPAERRDAARLLGLDRRSGERTHTLCERAARAAAPRRSAGRQRHARHPGAPLRARRIGRGGRVAADSADGGRNRSPP